MRPMTFAVFLTLASAIGLPKRVAAQSELEASNQPDPLPPVATAPPTNAPEKAPLQLEVPKPNQGHFLAIGLHSVAGMAFDNGRGTRKPTLGLGYSLRLGEAVTNWLDLGIGFAFASTQGEKQKALSLTRFTVSGQFHLDDQWFLRAGFGATNGQGADPEDLTVNRGRYGDVYLAGVGTTFYLSEENQSGGWTLSPVLTAEYGPDPTFSTAALWLGLELSWWSGLSRDKLELPIAEAYSEHED